jgi:hypothetical protein
MTNADTPYRSDVTAVLVTAGLLLVSSLALAGAGMPRLFPAAEALPCVTTWHVADSACSPASVTTVAASPKTAPEGPAGRRDAAKSRVASAPRPAVARTPGRSARPVSPTMTARVRGSATTDRRIVAASGTAPSPAPAPAPVRETMRPATRERRVAAAVAPARSVSALGDASTVVPSTSNKTAGAARVHGKATLRHHGRRAHTEARHRDRRHEQRLGQNRERQRTAAPSRQKHGRRTAGPSRGVKGES